MTLKRFRALCEQLLAEGIKPTPTEFAKRGLGYTQGSGSGCTWTSGKYTAARREVLLAAGWHFHKYPKARYEGAGRWLPPTP